MFAQLCHSADATVTPDGAKVALSNAISGFDIYDIDSGSPQGSLPTEDSQRRAIPILYIHGGKALVSGGTAGQATLWDPQNRCRHHGLSVKGTSDSLFSLGMPDIRQITSPYWP